MYHESNREVTIERPNVSTLLSSAFLRSDLNLFICHIYIYIYIYIYVIDIAFMWHIYKDCDMIAHTCDISVTCDIQYTLGM